MAARNAAAVVDLFAQLAPPPPQPVAAVPPPVMALPPTRDFTAYEPVLGIEHTSPGDLARPGFIEVAAAIDDWRIGLTGQAGVGLIGLDRAFHVRTILDALDVAGWLRVVPERASAPALAVDIAAPIPLEAYLLLRQILNAVLAGQLAPEPGTEEHLLRWTDNVQRVLQYQRDLARTRGETDV